MDKKGYRQGNKKSKIKCKKIMLIQLFISIFLGLAVGTVTGLIPGIHINLVSIIILSSLSFFLKFTDPLIISVFILTIAIAHTFFDSISTIFLGAPEADTSLGVLPGHRLLLEGFGYEAVAITVFGSLISLGVIILLSPLLILYAGIAYSFISQYIVYILLAVSLFFILEQSNKLLALSLFLLAGSLGLVGCKLCKQD
ncbi:tripartite tricarboxylate transporter permease [Candidatus Woesearchaeota archaeon]|nr:tripartite tricarboxylate transporter permease [Candidatus Woesearchaeota archaeon]